MIFKALLYYALAKGAWKGLHKPKPMSMADFDNLLNVYYIQPIMQQLNQRYKLLMADDYSQIEEVLIEAGSML